MMRPIWIVLMVALAGLACGAELDRAARRQPELAPLVPAPFRAFAQEGITMANVRSAEPAIALEEARTLIARSPVPAEHLTLLAIAQERSGDRQGSARLIQRAAQRGWRDPIAQQAMFDIAFQAGDMAEATNRFAALWALREDQAPLEDMAKRLFSRPDGRQALSRQIVSGGNWASAFLRSLPDNLTPEAAETLAMALKGGARVDCSVAPRLKNAFLKRGQRAEASLLDACTSPRG